MENQESPQTDQDVIDWILDNLIEKTRTRRGVIKKLKDLGLIFKAPTKKSNAAAVNKNLFIKDEDNKLQELYDEHRLEADCLKRIMVVFDKKRSKKAVLKRMVQLGLIADESEILPEKELKSRKERGEQNSSSESSDEEEAVTSAPSRNFNLNQREAVALRAELEESQKEAIEWIVESLNEAAEDFEEASDEVDDAIPIVPFTESQKSAVDDSQFQKLLAALNFIVPKDRESYWKIPANMMPDELRQRAKLLLGKEVPVDEDKQLESEDEDEDLFSKLRNQRDALMYNEGDSPTAVKGTKQKLQKVVEKVTSEEESSDEDQQNIIKRKNQQPIMESDGLDINTQELKQRLAELNDSSDDEQNATTQKKKNLLESSDDDELPTILRKRKSVKRDRSELEEETPDENEMNASNNNQLKRIRRIADSSDDE